ncbi:MAG: heavy metal translocating P-type ATPase metal-binding domain-containing protein [Verrucomicrobiota bacterium]
MSLAAIACRHCGTYFSPQKATEEFCCNGCHFVFDWINKENLGKFYELKGKRITDAIGNTVFEPTDWEWVDRWLSEAEQQSDNTTSSAEIHLQGISCLACAWLIEKRFAEYADDSIAASYPQAIPPCFC